MDLPSECSRFNCDSDHRSDVLLDNAFRSPHLQITYNFTPLPRSRILPAASFQSALADYLQTILAGNHPVAIIKAKSMIRQVQLRTLLEGQQKSAEMMASHSITGIPAQQIARKAAELKGGI